MRAILFLYLFLTYLNTVYGQVNPNSQVIQNNNKSLTITPDGVVSDNANNNTNLRIGLNALKKNIDGYNIALGNYAMADGINGTQNIAIGLSSLYGTFGSYNVGIGGGVLNSSTTGSYNTAVGNSALGLTSNGKNTAIGYQAGYGTINFPDSSGVYVGYQAGKNEPGSNKLYISNTETNIPLIWGDFWEKKLGFFGKVGINTKDPIDPLHIHDTTAFPQSFLRFTNTFSGKTATDGFRIGLSEFMSGVIWHFEDKPIVFGTNNSSRMIINENGNVGINTQDPNQKLQINNGAIRLRNVTDNKNWDWNYDEENNYAFFDEFGVGRKLFLRNGPNPLVGIGVNPTYNLHVKSNTNQTQMALDNAGGGLFFTAKIDEGIINQTGGKLSLRTGDLERVTIFPNSNRIGINVPSGTVTTAYSLDVFDGFSLVNSSIRIIPSAWQSNSSALLLFGDANHFVKATHSVGMQIHDANKIKLTGSNVGLGDSDPDAKLEVDGYTMLGSDAPKIKTKFYEESASMPTLLRTSVSEGGVETYDLGISSSRILSVNIFVDYGSQPLTALRSDDFVPPSYTSTNGYQFDFVLNGNIIEIKNHPTNSENILEKYVRIFITYRE